MVGSITIWWIIPIILSILLSGVAFIWLALKLDGKGPAKSAQDSYSDAASHDVEHIFNDDFRQELRNRGRLHFEKIIGDNAMFLQQDLRLTTSQLNEYMKSEITNKLREEFDKYEQSISDAKKMAIESIEKTNAAVDEQRKTLSAQLKTQADLQKTRLIKEFEANMADIINHYVLAAIGNEIDLNDQLEYILNDLEANKAAMIEDMKSGY